jgi:hypothetical protein
MLRIWRKLPATVRSEIDFHIKFWSMMLLLLALGVAPVSVLYFVFGITDPQILGAVFTCWLIQYMAGGALASFLCELEGSTSGGLRRISITALYLPSLLCIFIVAILISAISDSSSKVNIATFFGRR